MEDQTIVREGLRTLLGLVDDIEVVGEMVDGEEAVQLIPGHTPDVVLLDMRLPKFNGLEVLLRLGKAEALPPTIILTTFDGDSLVIEGLKAGAKGYLLKDVSLEQLTGAIRQVAAGGTAIQPGVTSRIVEGLRELGSQLPALDPHDPLTEREIEVLRMVAGGYSNREIGEGLHLAEGTVKNHLSSVLSKLGVRDRTQAVLKGVELGYIS